MNGERHSCLGYDSGNIVICPSGSKAIVTGCRGDGKLDAEYLDGPMRGEQTILEPLKVKLAQ